MRQAEPNFLKFFSLFSEDFDDKRIISLGKELDDETLDFIARIYEIHSEITNTIPWDAYDKLAAAHETKLLPLLDSEKAPFNIHLRDYIYLLKYWVENGNDSFTDKTNAFINDVLKTPLIIQSYKKGGQL